MIATRQDDAAFETVTNMVHKFSLHNPHVKSLFHLGLQYKVRYCSTTCEQRTVTSATYITFQRLENKSTRDYLFQFDSQCNHINV